MNERSFAKIALTLIFTLYSLYYLKKNFSLFKTQREISSLSRILESETPPNRPANSILAELKQYEDLLTPCPQILYYLPEKMNPGLTLEKQISLYSLTPCFFEKIDSIPKISSAQKILLISNDFARDSNLSKVKIIRKTKNYSFIEY